MSAWDKLFSRKKTRVLILFTLLALLLGALLIWTGLWDGRILEGRGFEGGGRSSSPTNQAVKPEVRTEGKSDSRAERASSKPAALISVKVVPVTLRNLPITTSATAQVVSAQTVAIRPLNLNTVIKIHVKQGQTVRRGQLLFTLDKRADKIALEKAEAQLHKDRASLLDLTRQKQRNTELQAQGFISQAQVDNLDTQIAVMQAVIEADETVVKSAQLTLENDEILAPFGGRLGAINVATGAQVQPSAGSVPLVTLNRMDPIEVQFSLPEKNLYNLRDLFAKKAPVQIILANQKLINGMTAPVPFNGKVSFVDNKIDPQTGLISVYAQVDNPHQALWPGQYVKVNLILGSVKNALVIPSNALLIRDGGQGKADVYVVDQDSVVQKMSLAGVQIFDDLAVVKELKEGDRVVVEGRQNLRPNQKVQVSP